MRRLRPRLSNIRQLLGATQMCTIINTAGMRRLLRIRNRRHTKIRQLRIPLSQPHRHNTGKIHTMRIIKVTRSPRTKLHLPRQVSRHLPFLHRHTKRGMMPQWSLGRLRLPLIRAASGLLSLLRFRTQRRLHLVHLLVIRLVRRSVVHRCLVLTGHTLLHRLPQLTCLGTRDVHHQQDPYRRRTHSIRPRQRSSQYPYRHRSQAHKHPDQRTRHRHRLAQLMPLRRQPLGTALLHLPRLPRRRAVNTARLHSASMHRQLGRCR